VLAVHQYEHRGGRTKIPMDSALPDAEYDAARDAALMHCYPMLGRQRSYILSSLLMPARFRPTPQLYQNPESGFRILFSTSKAHPTLDNIFYLVLQPRCIGGIARRGESVVTGVRSQP